MTQILFEATPEAAPTPPRKIKVTREELAAIVRQHFATADQQTLTRHQRDFLDAHYQEVRYEPMPIPVSASHHAEILAAQRAARDEYNAGIEQPVYVPPQKAPSKGVFF